MKFVLDYNIVEFLLTEQRDVYNKGGSNLYKSFPSSIGKTRQCRADAVCKSRGSKINLGENILTLGLEKVNFTSL